MSKDFAQKMRQYETPVPPLAWEAIAAQLDTPVENTPLAQRLYAYEVSPPSNAWGHIIDELRHNTISINTTPVRKLPSFRHIAVAASFIGLLALGIWYYKVPASNAAAYIQPAGNSNHQTAGEVMIQNGNNLSGIDFSSYATTTLPNGFTVRVSPKFQQVLQYVSASPQVGNNKNAALWKNRVEGWQEKIRQSNFTPGSGNFLDIIALQELLEEK